MQSLDK